jgi:hypothetical protein
MSRGQGLQGRGIYDANGCSYHGGNAQETSRLERIGQRKKDVASRASRLPRSGLQTRFGPGSSLDLQRLSLGRCPAPRSIWLQRVVGLGGAVSSAAAVDGRSGMRCLACQHGKWGIEGGHPRVQRQIGQVKMVVWAAAGNQPQASACPLLPGHTQNSDRCLRTLGHLPLISCASASASASAWLSAGTILVFAAPLFPNRWQEERREGRGRLFVFDLFGRQSNDWTLGSLSRGAAEPGARRITSCCRLGRGAWNGRKRFWSKAPLRVTR